MKELSLLPDRFWSKVDQSDHCWTWIAGRTSQGYGSFYWEGSRVYPHRLVYLTLVGPIPDGMELDHLCRNRACCNPAHLEPVTHGENIARGTALEVAAGIRTSRRACPRGHEWTPENTYVRSQGDGRSCRACIREDSRKYRKSAKYREARARRSKPKTQSQRRSLS